MENKDEHVKRRLFKVLQLAERGVGGEKSNAKTILAAGLKKYGLTLDELTGGHQRKVVEGHAFTNKIERKLLWQIIAVVGNVSSVTGKSRGKKYYVELTPVQHIEVDAMFGYYRGLLEKEIWKLLVAFVNKHDLFNDESRQRSSRGTGNDQADSIDGDQLAAMMAGMKIGSYRKQLSESKGR